VRLRKKAWIKEAIQTYSDIVVSNPLDGYQGKWREIMNKEAPLYVELGTGRGRFITGMAEVHPNINFIGLEAVVDVLYDAAQKAQEHQLSNIKLAVFDVNHILDVFAPGEIDRLYINFCDPWPKNRHAKRRLTHAGFLEKYRQVLKAGGELFFKTDNEKLFEFSLNQFAAANLKLSNITFDLHNSDFEGNIMTEYETKFSSQGMKIYRCEARF
jgi:tRNA (guanine-N7-)-methyltransferase